MNVKNRHNRYRKSIYRRRNIGTIVIISIVCIAVMLTAFLVIGNLLHKQSERRNEQQTNESEQSQDSSNINEKTPVKSINGQLVFLETQENGVFADRLYALTEKQCYEASIPLNAIDGSLLFKSSVADKIGYPTKNANVTLEDAVSAATEYNVYLSGIFYVNAFKESDQYLRAVELSCTAAIIAEALNAGFDDVILIAPDMTEAHVDEAIRFIEDIKALSKTGNVGLTVSDSILMLENTRQVSEIISQLDSKIDFLAIDTSTADILNGYTAIGDKISSLQLYLHLYKMRVLLPCGEDAMALNSIIAEAEKNGIKNIQIIPY